MSKNSRKNFRNNWNVEASLIAKRTHNPIRSIVENIVVEPNPDKQLIALSIGDPTTFGNLKPPKEVIKAVHESIDSQLYNGYAPSTGYKEARQAVAEYSSNEFTNVQFKDVVLCSGCSSALDLCITALAREGQNIIIPRPGFSIYRTLAEGLGITVKSYNLQPEFGWEIDLNDLEAQIDESTAAIIINNPSNPCGSVFSRDHLLDILQVAAKYYVPIIADEIYEHMTHALLAYELLSKISGLKPIMPDGAMYMMVHIDLPSFPEFDSELQFVKTLLAEESVFCLPGQCFDYPSYMRLVITIPKHLLEEACLRINEFCYRHHAKNLNNINNSVIVN
uniref:Aminotransferase class I/classII large domain-containing protein n=1 Tax=Trichogramma kaykai TaxID=54128 RepID=A0ABD2VTN3_9HYME